MLACSGMFGCVSGPVTTARCRAGRAEHRCRKRASNLHRSCVFVQDRMGGGGEEEGEALGAEVVDASEDATVTAAPDAAAVAAVVPTADPAAFVPEERSAFEEAC